MGGHAGEMGKNVLLFDFFRLFEHDPNRSCIHFLHFGCIHPQTNQTLTLNFFTTFLIRRPFHRTPCTGISTFSSHSYILSLNTLLYSSNALECKGAHDAVKPTVSQYHSNGAKISERHLRPPTRTRAALSFRGSRSKPPRWANNNQFSAGRKPALT